MKTIALYEHLYSQNAPHFESENKGILKGVDCVRREVQDRGIWMMDREGDHPVCPWPPLAEPNGQAGRQAGLPDRGHSRTEV